MKKLLIAVGLAAALVGCTINAQRRAYNSLATTGITEQTAYEAYLTEVLKGVVTTNDVPAISAKHRQFKALFDAACAAASFQTNFTETPPEVIAAGGAVTSAIATTKK